MKKNYRHARSLIVFIAITSLLVSCSKDQVFVTQNPTAQSADGLTNSKVKPPATRGGSLMVLVLPADAKPIITIVNENFSSTNFYLTKAGSLRIDNVPPGIYKVAIHAQYSPAINTDFPTIPDGPGYADIVIPNVKIVNEVVTDLGIIKLQ